MIGAKPRGGKVNKSCVVTTGDAQDPFHTTLGVFVNNHRLGVPFVVQSGQTLTENNIGMC